MLVPAPSSPLAVPPDRDAFIASYDRLAPALLALAERILGAREEAERVIEEAFTAAWREGSAQASLLFLDVRRRALSLRSPRTGAENVRELLGNAPDRERARKMLGELSLRERSVLELAYFEGLRVEEIAAKLSAPPSEIREATRAGVAKLSALLRGEGGAS